MFSLYVPSSSQVSLITASRGLSLFSILPPGKDISLGCVFKFLDLNSNNI